MSGAIGSLMKAAHAPIYASRLRVLVRAIVPHLRPGDRLLDVGCGVGTLAKAITDDPACPEGVRAEGLESHPRGGEPIPVTAYDGGRFPFDDGSFDMVTIADVLHHDHDPDRLLRECVRVSRRFVIVKDHQIKGAMAQKRVSLIDWAANAPHGVPCLYQYKTPMQWSATPGALGVDLVHEHRSMNLYPPLVNMLFGRSLQYMAVYAVKPGAGEGGAS